MKGVYIASGADDSYEPEVGHETNDRKHRKKDALGVNISYLGRLKTVTKKKRKKRWDKKNSTIHFYSFLFPSHKFPF